MKALMEQKQLKALPTRSNSKSRTIGMVVQKYQKGTQPTSFDVAIPDQVCISD